MSTWIRGRAVFLFAATLALTACAQATGEKKPGLTSKMAVARVVVPGGAKGVLLVSSLVDGGLGFTRPPQDLHGSWAIEVTAGIYEASPTDVYTQALFGLEADLRGTTSLPSEFYGVYCRYFLTPSVGMQVFASSHDGNHGQTFFTGAKEIDLRIETDGSAVTYKARDHAVGGAYTEVGKRTLETPAGAHQAGFGMFNGRAGTGYGFSAFRIPANGGAAVPPGAAQIALNQTYDAARSVLEAAYALGGPVVTDAEVAAAKNALATADGLFDVAKSSIAALAPSAARKKALKAVAAADKAVGKARGALDKKGLGAVAGVVTSITKKMFKSGRTATDALLPDDLRAALPGGGI